ncbi:MAG: elongation factor G [Candidatus Omnitrophica bacterium]|nr:elongation factor G [Candidatus Omnitrophota bacterium]
MRTDLSKKRVFLFCGHAQSGKTALSEALLHACGATKRLGRVEEGTTVSDHEEDEKDRRSSINLSLLHAEHNGLFLQFIDTPGYLDFLGELAAGIRAVDFAVIAVDAANGVEVGTERAWNFCQRLDLPCIFFVTKLDKENTSFEETAEDIKKSFSKAAVPCVQFAGGEAKSVLKTKDPQYYNPIMETVAESDDSLIEKYLESGTIAQEQLLPALQAAVANRQFFPILGGVPVEEKGIDTLLEYIEEFMPSVAQGRPRAAEKEGEEVRVEPKADGPFTAQIIKTFIDPFVGKVSIFRVHSGSITSNTDVMNVNQHTKEKIGQISILQGKQQVAQDGISAGEIGAVAKLKEAVTGDSLCEKSFQVRFPGLQFPPPAYSASVKPKTRQDEEKISTALARLALEDPTCKISRDSQTHELIVSGMGELHLHVIIERMKRKYGADVDLGTPKVPYRETIAKPADVQHRYKKQTGGRGQFAEVYIKVEPLERGKDFEFVNQIVGGAIPRNFIPSVEKGIRKAMEQGILAGYHVADIKVTLYDGSYHPVDSSDMAFQICGSMALRKALEQGRSVLLEPVMEVEIAVPEEVMGQVTGDISSRRGRVQGMEMRGKNEVVKAFVPLAEMFKYASDLRSVTGGRGAYTMHFSHYDVVPDRIGQTIIAQAQQEKQTA